jgi:hypothetical protein
LGELIGLLEDPKKWQRIQLKTRVHQPDVVKRLHEVREIRNDVVHFNPDPTSKEDLEKLSSAERFLRSL